MSDPLDELADAARSHRQERPRVTPAAATPKERPTRIANPLETGFKFMLGAYGAVLTIFATIILCIILTCAGCLTLAKLTAPARAPLNAPRTR